MFPTVLTALGGAAGLAALLSPVLVHLTQRRLAAQTQNTTLIGELQEERDAVVARLDQRDAMIAALWQAYYDLRYWIVKGCEGNPPTMPPGLTVAAVRTRADA